MCQQIGHRHSVLCAVPPYVLSEAARNGGAEDREAALKTLSIDNTQRTPGNSPCCSGQPSTRGRGVRAGNRAGGQAAYDP